MPATSLEYREAGHNLSCRIRDKNQCFSHLFPKHPIVRGEIVLSVRVLKAKSRGVHIEHLKYLTESLGAEVPGLFLRPISASAILAHPSFSDSHLSLSSSACFNKKSR